MSYRTVQLSDLAPLYNALHEWKHAGGSLEEVTDTLSNLIEQRIARAIARTSGEKG